MQVDTLVAPEEGLDVPAAQSEMSEEKCKEDCVNGVRSDERGGRVGSKFKIRVSRGQAACDVWGIIFVVLCIRFPSILTLARSVACGSSGRAVLPLAAVFARSVACCPS